MNSLTDAQMVKNVHRQFANGTPKQSLSFPGASSPPGDGGVLVSLHHMQVTAEQRHAELEVITMAVTTVCGATGAPFDIAVAYARALSTLKMVESNFNCFFSE